MSGGNRLLQRLVVDAAQLAGDPVLLARARAAAVRPRSGLARCPSLHRIVSDLVSTLRGLPSERHYTLLEMRDDRQGSIAAGTFPRARRL